MASWISFWESERAVPRLSRGWRTPDPSPTRTAVGVPRCKTAEVTFECEEEASCSASTMSSDLKQCAFIASSFSVGLESSRVRTPSPMKVRIDGQWAPPGLEDVSDADGVAPLGAAFRRAARALPSLRRGWRTPDTSPTPTRDCAKPGRELRDLVGLPGLPRPPPTGKSLTLVAAETAAAAEESTQPVTQAPSYLPHFHMERRESTTPPPPAFAMNSEHKQGMTNRSRTPCKEGDKAAGQPIGVDGVDTPLFVDFIETAREVPSLSRGYRTPDPSPTRTAVGLPRCAPAELMISPSGNAKLGHMWPSDMTDLAAGWKEGCSLDSEKGRESPVIPEGEFITTRQSSVDSDAAASPLATRKVQEESLQTAEETPDSPTAGAMADGSVTISVGTVGHPLTCAPACKYQYKARHKGGTCKEGAACDHCHLCDWKPLPRHWKKRRGKAQSLDEGKESPGSPTTEGTSMTPASPKSPMSPTSVVSWEC